MSLPRMADYFDFSGRHVLVTGAASGIGSAVAAAFQAHGATLLLADRQAGPIRETAAHWSAPHAHLVYDQGDPDSVESLLDAAGDVDVLFNNAGVALRGPAAEAQPAQIQRTVQVNLVGPLTIAARIGAAMAARGRGAIVSTSSQLAFCGAGGLGVYSATKAALAQFTRSAAVELGPRGVRVNCIAPGRTRTPMTAAALADPTAFAEGLRHIPLGRYGEPGDMAAAVLFLASDAASYITGQTLIIDGGYVLA
ncbi:MAG: glucose 1-dehydrogenase [Candidatus Lambdaproteobacteria bacterium]|nr:glucose 1-dehydrogenase [Candidatus Lambdaproteobacteria bacterium]